jgi:mitochondrial import inner membrane translocase subunit TIM23
MYRIVFRYSLPYERGSRIPNNVRRLSTHTDQTRNIGKTVSNSSPSLTWNDYFYLRKWRTYRQRMVGIPLGVGSLLGTSYGTMMYIFERMKPDQLMFGMDPMIVAGLAGIGSGIIGYMAGVVLSGVVWRLTHQKKALLMDEKDKDFAKKIEKFRADPSTQPLFGGLPDYYGEKIYSIQQYRKWLKSQRSHKRHVEIELFKIQSKNTT